MILQVGVASAFFGQCSFRTSGISLLDIVLLVLLLIRAYAVSRQNSRVLVFLLALGLAVIGMGIVRRIYATVSSPFAHRHGFASGQS